MGLSLRGQLEQAPVDVREAGQELTDFQMVFSHAADLRDQVLAHIFGDGFAVAFGGQVIAALGGVFMERALEEVQGLVDLPHQLFLAEAERITVFAHKCAYIYAYFKAPKSPGQEKKIKKDEKR